MHLLRIETKNKILVMSASSDYTSSGSVSSYSRSSSISSHSSSTSTGFCQRFMHLLCDNFKRVICVKIRNQSPAFKCSYDNGDISSNLSLCRDFDLDGQQLEWIDSEGEVEEPADNIQILRHPGVQGPVYIMFQTNEFTRFASPNNKLTAKQDMGSLAALLLEREPSLIVLNFPKLEGLFGIQSNDKESEGGREDNTPMKGDGPGWSEECDAGNTESDWPPIVINGEVKVYKSGRVTLTIDSNVFEMTKAASPPIKHEVIYVDVEDRMYSKSLGEVDHYIDVTPVLEK